MKIKNFKLKIKNFSSGFTLIELLIVIALLGSLAVGLLATVDPFEQLKKGRDTATRNTVSEIYNGMIRYYSINSYFPWKTTAQSAAVVNSNLAYVSAVITAGELKEKFVDLATTGRLEKVLITSTAPATGNKEQISVCFAPESKAFRNDDNAMFDAAGVTVADVSSCTGRGGSATCYWCVQ
jgi:prepilin-type N-terminal cleavage/methylation domain-containing protein